MHHKPKLSIIQKIWWNLGSCNRSQYKTWDRMQVACEDKVSENTVNEVFNGIKGNNYKLFITKCLEKSEQFTVSWF